MTVLGETELRDFYESRVEEKWVTTDNPEMERLVQRISDWLRPEVNALVLDIGCYDGYTSSHLAAGTGVRVIGVDLAIKAVELARASTSQGGVDFVACDCCMLPFSDNSVDAIVCSELLEHVPMYDGLLSEMARVIKPNGLLYATMPNSLESVWPPLRGTCRLIDRVEGHLRRPSLQEFADELGQFGFHVRRHEYRGFALTALWYRLTVYNTLARRAGQSVVVGASPSRMGRAVRDLIYLSMKGYMSFDRLFRYNSGGMGIDALFEFVPPR